MGGPAGGGVQRVHVDPPRQRALSSGRARCRPRCSAMKGGCRRDEACRARSQARAGQQTSVPFSRIIILLPRVNTKAAVWQSARPARPLAPHFFARGQTRAVSIDAGATGDREEEWRGVEDFYRACVAVDFGSQSQRAPQLFLCVCGNKVLG